MTERIVFKDGTTFLCPERAEAPVHPFPMDGRQWRRITVKETTLEAVASSFVDNAEYTHEWDSSDRVISEDLSAFSIAGDIVDTRDGNITVYMGKPTELDLTHADLEEAEAAMREGVNSLVVD